MSSTYAMHTRAMMSDEEYKALQARVARGKELLDGKWGAVDWETREWINIWFKLSDILLQEMRLRGVFKGGRPHQEILEQADEHLEKIRQQMIAKGYIKKPRERRAKKIDQSESNSISLFTTS